MRLPQNVQEEEGNWQYKRGNVAITVNETAAKTFGNLAPRGRTWECGDRKFVESNFNSPNEEMLF
jgi:hypothetical protein